MSYYLYYLFHINVLKEQMLLLINRLKWVNIKYYLHNKLSYGLVMFINFHKYQSRIELILERRNMNKQ